MQGHPFMASFVLKKDYETFCTQIEVKKSKFIAEVFAIKNASQVREILKAQKQKYRDARHVVHAFVLADGNVMGCSDDGEPSGTAGKPVLDVLKGSGLEDAMICVTRYFGGILLGTGGLVKAYSDCAKLALTQIAEKNLLEERVEKKEFDFSVSYDLYDVVKKIIVRYGSSELKEDFQEAVHIVGEIPQKDFDLFCKEISESTFGKINLEN